MRKLAPVFLISVFALASANALAMGDRQKSKSPSNATTPSTVPATPSTVPSTDTTKDKVASNNSAAKTNPAGTSPNCFNGKDSVTGKDCQALGGDSGSSGPGAAGGSSGSSSSSSGSSGSSGSSAGSSK